MLVMNKRGMDKLMSSKFTLGGDASVAAGPVGRTAEAKTDAYMTAEILAWSRSRGLFAGVSLSGATLRSDEDENAELYGKKMTIREVVDGNPPAPAAAKPLLAQLSKYSPVAALGDQQFLVGQRCLLLGDARRRRRSARRSARAAATPRPGCLPRRRSTRRSWR